MVKQPGKLFRRVVLSVFAVLGAVPVGSVLAFPDKPVTLVVPFGAGGGTDTLARMIAPVWEKHLGQKVVVVNRPGGSGIVGARSVLQSGGDGYTVLMYQPPQINLAVEYQGAPFSLDDFIFINLLTKDDALFFTGPDAKWFGIADVIEDARANPGRIKVGIALAMGMDYIYVKELEERTGVRFGEVIPLAGGGDLLREVMGGHIDIGVSGAWVARVQKGSIKPLAVRATARSPIWPDTPSLNEVLERPYTDDEIAGSAPSYKGIAVPAALKESHPDRFAILADSFRAMVQSPEFGDTVKKFELETTIAFVGPDKTRDVITRFSENLSRYDDYFTRAASQ